MSLDPNLDRLETLSGEIAELKADIQGLRAELRTKPGWAGVTALMAAILAIFLSAFTGLLLVAGEWMIEAKFEVVDLQLSSIENRLDGIESRFDAIDGKLASIPDQVIAAALDAGITAGGNALPDDVPVSVDLMRVLEGLGASPDDVADTVLVAMQGTDLNPEVTSFLQSTFEREEVRTWNGVVSSLVKAREVFNSGEQIVFVDAISAVASSDLALPIALVMERAGYPVQWRN